MSKQLSRLGGRRQFTAEFKVQVVLELIRGDLSLSESSARYDIKDTVLSRWKQEFLERAPSVFDQSGDSGQEKISELEKLIGQQTVELNILKKASGLLRDRKGSGS